MVSFGVIMHYYTFQHCLDTGMQNGDDRGFVQHQPSGSWPSHKEVLWASAARTTLLTTDGVFLITSVC